MVCHLSRGGVGEGVRVAVGHANPDFDAYASTVAATKLFPGTKAVYLGSQNANVRSFHNLHEELLDFIDLKELDLDEIDSVVMVDTRDPDRIGPLGDVVRRPGVDVIVYDHHRRQADDIIDADDRSMETGSTTSILVHEIAEAGIALAPIEASLMLLGIHEDTGSLTYAGSTSYDADAVAYLMSAGADVEVLNEFLSRTLDPSQRRMLDELEASLEVVDINGQQVAIGVAHADEYVDSASVLTHYVVEDMGYRVAVGIIDMPGRVQIVARSRIPEVDVGAVMARIGGGGHSKAASAGFRELATDEAVRMVREALEAEVVSPLRARDIMSAPVRTVTPTTTMAEAAEVMSRWGHGGLPVVEDGSLLGIVSRRDVDKAVRHGLDHAPVTGFMGREIVSVLPQTRVSELQRILASRNVGRVPVIEDGRMIGIVTRKDVLRAEYGESYLDRMSAPAHGSATETFRANIERMLPPNTREVLYRIGSYAADAGLRAYVVGGFVRDMLLGRMNTDLDVVVEGDGVSFAEGVASSLGVRARVHRRFGTAILVFDDGFHVDVASSRSEFYAKPGALPTVDRSTLHQDLFRRDFSINAMAASIEPDSFGRIVDPFGGLADLESGSIRILHGLSFIDDPTRLLRAAKFEVRYGFVMTRGTERQALRAVELGVIDEVSGARLREELLDILGEKEPVAILARLEEIGVLSAVLPGDAHPDDAIAAVSGALVGLEVFESITADVVDRTRALLVAIGTSGSPDAALRWVRSLRIGREAAASIRAVVDSDFGVARALTDRRGMRDSRLYRLLEPFEHESLVNLWAKGDRMARERIERYVTVLSRMEAAVNGDDLIALGAVPDARFSAILTQARDDRLDGRAVGRQAELANLKRLARRANVI